MTLEELSLFLNELISTSEFYLPKNKQIPKLVLTLDKHELLYHVEGDQIWPIKNWQSSLEAREKRRELERINTAKVHKVQEAIDKIKEGLRRDLLLTDEVLIEITAIEIYKKNTEAASHFAKEDLSVIPKLDKYHLMKIEGGYVNIGAEVK